MADRYASLKQGLVGCWIPSISGSGLLLPDLSGRGNNGSLVNMDASDWVSSGSGRALDIFDDQYIDGGTMQGLSLAYPFSMSCWIQNITSNNVDFSPFAKTRQVGTYQGPMIYFASATNATVVAYWAGGTRATGATVVTQLSNWTHVGICWTGSQARVYVNGRLDGTGNTATAPNASTASVNIGRYNSEGFGQRSMRGRIDDCRIYDRCLTDSEWSLLASDRGIGFKPAKKLSFFSTRYTYQPPKAKVFEGVRVRDHDYSSLRQGLVGAWCPSLPNGGGGNTLPDVSGRGNNGTLTNMSPDDWVSGQYGRALDFDGVNDYSTTTLSAGISGSFTFSCWAFIRTLDASVRPFITSQVASYNNYWASLGTFQSRLSFGLYDGTNNPLTGDTGVGFAPNTNQWYHFVGVRDVGADTISDYVNGVFNRSVTDTTTSVPTYGALTIGGQTAPAGRYVNGLIDDVRVYNRALSPAEIRLLASRPGIGLQPSPTQFIAREKKTGLRRKILTGQT